MALAQAVYDATSKTYHEQPFCFDPVAVFPGRQLDEDMDIYCGCVARAGLMPNAPSLLFMGKDALGLFLRRNATREDWRLFIAEFVRHYPLVAARNDEIIARVVAMASGDRSGATAIWQPTTPETCLGAILLDVLPSCIRVVADAPLPGGRSARGHVRRCDFHLISRRKELRLEIAGLMNSDGCFPTFHGVKYVLTRLPARQAAYAALELEPPVTLYADEVLDRARLLPIVTKLALRLQ